MFARDLQRGPQQQQQQNRLRGSISRRLERDAQSPGGRARVAAPAPSAEARRSSWQARRVPAFSRPHDDDEEGDELIVVDDDEDELEQEEELDWRHAAQMLTERDEMLLLASRQPRSSDALDAAPVNRRLQAANQRARRSPAPQPARSSPSSGSSQQQQKTIPKGRSLFTSHRQLAEPEGRKTKSKSHTAKSPTKHKGLSLFSATSRHNDDDDEAEQSDDEQAQQADDNSSISFAQSGCHSILSAWRIKAANKAARLAAASRASHSREPPGALERPTSVLSNTSSQGRKSMASTTYTGRSSRLPAAQIARIPLGPKSAQHFVTNSRRRRRANELILNTLEARRRAISLNRQNLGSIFGSESYLGEQVAGGVVGPQDKQLLLDDYQRLSMSPSPLGLAGRTPSPFGFAVHGQPTGARPALSDLGGRQSPAMVAQRNKLLAQSKGLRHSPGPAGMDFSKKEKKIFASHSSLGSGRPPLAKLDQNSSDLCSSNDSSSGNEQDDDDESANSSEGSQFTQLVTSELAPSCLLLEAGSEQAGRKFNRSSSSSSALPRPTPAQRPREPPPRPPERTKRTRQQVAAASQAPAGRQQVSTTSEEEDRATGKLRRGALKRDSIRRLRLSRAQSEKQQQQQRREGEDYQNQSSSFDSYEQRDEQQAARTQSQQALKPLPKARKLDIENNPFLNRHHFRTLSTRSTESRQSLASQQQQPPAASGRRATGARLQSPIEDEEPERALARRRERAGSARSAPSPSRREQTPDRPQVVEHLESVRQVERMLRSMKPNEAISSRSRELATGHSSQARESSAGHRPGGKPETGGGSSENVFKTTTRLVREGARSSDDVKFDLAGNRRQRELDERWRHERLVPIRMPDGSTFSEQKFMSDRVEVLRQREEFSRTISPPPEFSDRSNESQERSPPVGRSSQVLQPQQQPPVRAQAAPQLQQQRQAPPPRPFQPTLPPRPSDRFGRGQAWPDESEFLARTSAGPPLSSPAGRAPSEERPPALRPRTSKPSGSSPPPLARASSQPSRPLAERARIEPKPLDRARVIQASLPKFERTGDDEFRKRVEQLRQMARANLEASEARQQQEARWRRDKQRLVRPMSTNWDATGEAAAAAKLSTSEERHRLEPLRLSATPPPASSSGGQFGRTSERSASVRQSARAPTVATDLDDMLLAERYQRPLSSSNRSQAPAGVWRRSNSSLASLSAPLQQQQQHQLRPTSPVSSAFGVPRQLAGQQVAGPHSPPSSVLSLEPRGEQATPVRLVVRERAAPKLDFAVVEQRPQAQLARSVVEPPRPSGQQQQQQQQTTRPGSSSAQLQEQNARGRNLQQARPPAHMTTSQAQSPEFGQAATSSADDSAIASSVSSPSPLSGNYATKQAHATTQGAAQTPSRTVSSSGGLRVSSSLDQAAAVASQQQLSSQGALQSILRRQQQQQQMASASSFPTPGQQRIEAPSGPLAQRSQSPARQPTASSNLAEQAPKPEAPRHATRGESPPQQIVLQPGLAQMQQQQQQAMVPKRVHFNDRTSIRSFESVSSSSASNTTAIQSSNLDDFAARQQVGSPDSMGSGSTSRLSNDSPAFGDFRRGGGGGGAAIYAVRGDPELEQQQQQQPVLPRPAVQFYAQRQPQIGIRPPQQQQMLAHHHLQPSIGMPPASIGQQQFYAAQQQQSLGSPIGGSIQMTAPPAIKTGPPPSASQSAYHQLLPAAMGPPQPHPSYSHVGGGQFRPQQQMMPAQHQQHQQQSPQRPTTMAQAPPPSHHLVTTTSEAAGDEDDPDYALRLRQAATRRAFAFVQPPAQQQVSPRQQQQQVGALSPQGPLQPAGARGGGGGGGAQMTRRAPTDLANFQTEV